MFRLHMSSMPKKKKRPALRCLYADAKVWKVQKRHLPRTCYAEIPWKHFKRGLHTTPHHMRVSATNLTWKLKYLLLQLPRLMVKVLLDNKKNNHICTSCVVPSNILTLCMIWISPWGHHLICSFGWLSDWPENVELIILRVWKTWIESESMPLPLLALNEQNLGNFPFSPQTQWFLWPKKFWHFNLDIIYVILAFI